MATELYFDTARLGRMCPRARQAEQDFSKLASQLGSSLYWEQFLVGGFDTLPASLRRRCTGLSCWSGLAGLQQDLANYVALPAGGVVLFSGQSRTLITLAAEALFQRCQRVLATDLDWPPYLAILKAVAVRHNKTLRVLPVRQQVLTAACDRRTLIDQLVAEYFRYDCDGLFLSDITHTGVLVPYQQVLEQITRVQRPHFAVVDGAQAFGQRPVRLDGGKVDVYLAGTQKWFGAYHPLRVAFLASKATGVESLARRLIAKRRLTDPLAEFCQAVATGNWSSFGETVNLSALMTAAGALAGWQESPHAIFSRWHNRRINRSLVLEAVARLARSVIDDSLSAGIALLKLDGVNAATPACRPSIREALARQHVVASEPIRGLARLAMPGVRLTPAKLDRLREAFDRLPETLGHVPAHVKVVVPPPSSIDTGQMHAPR